MKKNRKGFTLIELIVAIVIIGMIVVLSVPAIRMLRNNGETQKYTTYQEALENSAKLYVDAYDEDLFGNEGTGCNFVTFGMLSDKGLFKDISVDGVSCATENTFVRVVKFNDNYSYTAYLGCGKETDIGVKDIDVIYPEASRPHKMDTSICSGYNSISSINIDVDKKNGKVYKKSYDVKLILSSYSGINSSINIEAAWSNSSIVDKNLKYNKIK